MHVYNWATHLLPPYANSRWARHAAAVHRASAKMRSGASRGSVRGSWATRHQLDMCTYMYRHIYIYGHLCIYACIQPGSSLPQMSGS